MSDPKLIRCSDHAQWLQERSRSVGSSDAAAILGASPFATPLSVYVSKVQPEPEEENEQMSWGHALEEPIALEFQRRTKLLVVAPPAFALYRREDLPHAHASPDRFVETEEQRVLEIKSTRYRAEDWDDGVPLHVNVQVQHQLLVLGLDVAYVAVLIQGQEYRQFELSADKAFQSALLEKLAEFWRRVETREPPAPTGASDYETVRRMFKRASKKTLLLPAAITNDFDLWLASKAARLASEKHEEASAARLMTALGDAEEGVLPDGRRLVWRNEEAHYKAQAERTVTKRVLRTARANKEKVNGIADSGTQGITAGDPGGEVRTGPSEVPPSREGDRI